MTISGLAFQRLYVVSDDARSILVVLDWTQYTEADIDLGISNQLLAAQNIVSVYASNNTTSDTLLQCLYSGQTLVFKAQTNNAMMLLNGDVTKLKVTNSGHNGYTKLLLLTTPVFNFSL